jgi:hypothetical protein
MADSSSILGSSGIAARSGTPSSRSSWIPRSTRRDERGEGHDDDLELELDVERLASFKGMPRGSRTNPTGRR